MNYYYKLILLLFLPAITTPQVGVHPKLFFSSADSTNIVNRINQSGSAAQALYGEITQQANHYVNMQTPQLFTEAGKWRYYENIPSLAFSYFVTGNQAYADAGNTLPSGIYFLELRVQQGRQVKKIVAIR